MQCGCVAEVNGLLADENARLCLIIGGGAAHGSPMLVVEKIAPRGRNLPVMMVTYCPFCGVKSAAE